MMDLAAPDLIEASSDTRTVGRSRREARPRSLRDTVSITPEEVQAELACSCQAGSDEQLDGPYEEGFGAFASGAGLADNPYAGDNCAHQQWENGWSMARDEAQRQARRPLPRKRQAR
jgi:hypothetical protein